MDRPEILNKIDALGPWFHCIDLGDGIKTKTASVSGEPENHPCGTWEIIKRCLPADLSGMSVLDVGCNAGFYAIESKRRGAARVLGVDAQRTMINQALFVRRVLGLDIDYQRMSVYDLSRRSVGVFDVTLALGLIYHCKHLVLALEKLFEVTRELLIIETAMLPTEKTPDSFADPVAGPAVMLHPLVYVENSAETKEPVFNWFLPGPKTLAALLRNVGFGEVTFFDLQPTGRAVVLCRKVRAGEGNIVLSQFEATLELETAADTGRPGAQMRFRVKAQNSGEASWRAEGSESDARVVRLGAHLLATNEELLIWDYGRAQIAHDLRPDESQSLTIELPAPDEPGDYIVEFDMVLEHVSWFEDLGMRTIRHTIAVR